MGLPVQLTRIEGKIVHLEFSNLGATYDGTLEDNGNEIRGTFTQGIALPLVFRRVDHVEVLKRPQLPQPPFPYDARQMSYENKSADLRLAGTLTIPHGTGPSPAVILITGSGPQDRDSTIAGHKPFLVIADHLTRRGIAVLRVDDRGVGGSQGNAARASLEDLASDVLAGVAYLKSLPEIDPQRIGLIGHSEGGIVAPLAAAQSKDVAFLVLLAGPGVPGDKLVIEQNQLVLRSLGAQTEVVQWQVSWLREMIAVAKTEKDETAAAAKMRAAWEKAKAMLPEPIRGRDSTANAEAQLAMLNSPELRSFLVIDPADALRKIKIPVLALNGERDLQVSPEQNLPPISAALQAAGNMDFEIRELPGLNHMFQKCDLCTVAEYGSLEETFSPSALQVMGDWIVAHTQVKK
jgi:pimeloyl-ACP methyl ester carboxylesterase